MQPLIHAGLENSVLSAIGSAFKLERNKRNNVGKTNCFRPFVVNLLYFGHGNMGIPEIAALFGSNGALDSASVVFPVREAGSAINGNAKGRVLGQIQFNLRSAAVKYGADVQ